MKAVAKKPARKAKTAALAPVDYVVPAGKVLVLRTCLADMRSPSCDAHGFIWPRSGPVECADWQPTKACGNGLHGVLWGEGDGGNPWVWDDTGVWLIVEVDASDVIELGGKVKFPRGVVVFSGPRLEATTMLGRLAPGRAIVGGTATAGDSGTATAGDSGEVRIRQWDSKAERYRTRVAWTGENGIKAGVAYRLNDAGEFVEAKS
jgi:hypothetical protein